MIVNVFCINWNIDVVVFLFESSKGGQDFNFFMGSKEGFLRLKLDLVLILIWDFPLILQRNSGLILNQNLLFLTNTFENRREE